MQQYKRTVGQTSYSSGLRNTDVNEGNTNNYVVSGQYRDGGNSLSANNYVRMTSSKVVSDNVQYNQMGQGGSRVTITSNKKIVSGQGQGQYRNNVEWEGEQKMVISGETDFSSLMHSKEILLTLLNEFNGKNKVVFEGDYKQDFNKRLLLLEHELEGTMRRVLNVSQIDPSGSKRSLDYTKLLNEKENALYDRDRKISNYQERLRAAEEKIVKLQIQTQSLSAVINQRNSQIQELRRQLQIKSNAIDKIRGQPAFANSQEVREIFKMVRMQEQGNARNQTIKSYISQLDRELTKLKSKQTSFADLQTGIESWIIGLPNQSILKSKIQLGQLRRKEDQSYQIMLQKFRVAGELYKRQIDQLKRDNPGLRLSIDEQIIQTLRLPNTKITSINVTGSVQIQKQVRVTKEVPVQDARTKYLIHALSMHVKKLNQKYPKLKAELDVKLQQFLSQQMIDMIQNDELDRIVDIVRYVPQMVKVQNVYTWNTQKSRKVQFHLRVLIKALLQEMEKVKREKGVVFQIDEGVIGMIRAEIMDLVDVDDILKVYRAVPKIVEVPKIIEKVVDNIVRVPQKYTVSSYQQQAVPLQKPMMAVDEKALIIQTQQSVPFFRQKPVEMMSHTEKVVSHPQMNERVAIQVREKTNLKPEEVLVEKIIQVEKPVYIDRQKIVIQKELQQVEIIKEVVRYIETEKEVPKEVEVIIQKIVQKIIEKERIVTVPQIIQKIVEVIKYEKVPQIVPHIETRVQIVREIVQKIVPVIQYQERIITVPQIIQKIVTVQKIIERPPRQIQVIKEVLKIVKQIEIVEVEVPRIVIQKEIQIREVEKYIQVPLIVPQVKIETEIHQVPFIQTVMHEKHIPVQVIKHIVLIEEKPVQVTRNVPYIMREEIPIMCKEERVVPMEMYFERIKQIPTTKEKIIQKIVEVPKCIEIERIVQKIVIVPRIVQKIVEVPQIIQKIVQKIVEVPVMSPPIQHFIERPCRVQVPVQVEREKIVYITVDRQIEVPGDTIMVTDTEVRTNIQIEKVIEERVRVHKEEVPVTLYVDKIISVPVEKHIVHQVDKIIVKPIEVPVPITLQKTMPVYINTETVHVEPVPNVIEKIVEKQLITKEVQIINQIEQKYAVQKKYQFKQIPKVYIEKQIQQVDRYEEKIVEVRTIIDQIKEVPYMVEKLIPIIQQIPKVYQYEKEPKIVYTPPTIQIVERIVPKIINVNKYIQKIVERLVQVPYLLREIEVIKELHQKNIPGPEKTNTTLKTVNVQIEKELIKEKQKIIETKVRFIEETLKVVTEVMERERDPVIITQDRIIEVPHVLQKIVEKIVVMPQVVEVLKYVNQMFQSDDLSAGLSIDVSVEAIEYKKLGEQLEKGFGQFLNQLNKIKSLQPSAAQRITLIQQYLAKFRRFIKYPKIHQIIKEKIVEKEKEKVVRVNVGKGQSEIREDLAKVLLIQKLIAEISRLKRTYPDISLQLQDDINFIFRLNFDGKVKDVNSKMTAQLKDFQSSLDRKFSKMGGWTNDHQMMLKSFLEERFVLANIVKSANEQIKQTKKQNEQLVMQIAKAKSMVASLYQTLIENKNMMPSIVKVLSKQKDGSIYMAYSILVQRFDDMITNLSNYEKEDFEPTRYLGKRFIQDLVSSSLRERERQIELLKEKLRTSKFRQNDHAQCNVIIQNLQFEINRLTRQLEDTGKGKDSTKVNTRSLQLEIERLNRQLRETSNSNINKNSETVINLQQEINRLNLVIQQTNNHNQCLSIQKGLQIQNQRLKKQIQDLLAKLRNAENQIRILRIQINSRERDIQSPKNSIGTKHTSSPRDQGKRSIVISQVERDRSEDDDGYGQNYFQYINVDGNGAGTLDSQGKQGVVYQQGNYHSSIHQPKDLTGSSATYRSGQVITSTQYIRNPNTINANSSESARYIQDRQNSQYSGTTSGVSGVKKYNYYQKKYEGGN